MITSSQVEVTVKMSHNRERQMGSERMNQDIPRIEWTRLGTTE